MYQPRCLDCSILVPLSESASLSTKKLKATGFHILSTDGADKSADLNEHFVSIVGGLI